MVPLVPMTAELFSRAIDLAGGSPFVFPSPITDDGILGEYTPRQAVERLLDQGSPGIVPFSPKDLRTTVKTGMARLGIIKEIRDAVQNHKPQGIGDRAYNFHAYSQEKREALQRWTDHVIAVVEATSQAKAA